MSPALAAFLFSAFFFGVLAFMGWYEQKGHEARALKKK